MVKEPFMYANATNNKAKLDTFLSYRQVLFLMCDSLFKDLCI